MLASRRNERFESKKAAGVNPRPTGGMSLALWERWRRSRRRGFNCAQRTLSPAIAGALPQGEPLIGTNRTYKVRQKNKPLALCEWFVCYTRSNINLKLNGAMIRAHDILMNRS